jgi:hypothetical protein
VKACRTRFKWYFPLLTAFLLALQSAEKGGDPENAKFIELRTQIQEAEPKLAKIS